jgi:hypothetical protein
MMINLMDDEVEVIEVVLAEKHVANHRNLLLVHEKQLLRKKIIQIK